MKAKTRIGTGLASLSKSSVIGISARQESVQIRVFQTFVQPDEMGSLPTCYSYMDPFFIRLPQYLAVFTHIFLKERKVRTKVKRIYQKSL